MSTPRFDALVPWHPKDGKTLGAALHSMREHCLGLGRIRVVSAEDPRVTLPKEDLPPDLEWIPESATWAFPFTLDDFAGCRPSPGWAYQQMLKLYGAVATTAPPIGLDSTGKGQATVGATTPSEPGLPRYVLLCDADVVWLRDVKFFEPVRGVTEGGARLPTDTAPATSGHDSSADPTPSIPCYNVYDAEGCPMIRSRADLTRYSGFLGAMLKGLGKRMGHDEETAVTHHMIVEGHLVRQLMAEVEAQHRDEVLGRSEGVGRGPGGAGSIAPAGESGSTMSGGAPTAVTASTFAAATGSSSFIRSATTHGRERQSQPSSQPKPFWAVFRDLALSTGGRVSEYELYFSYAAARIPLSIRVRALPFAVQHSWRDADPRFADYVVSHSHLTEADPTREGIINVRPADRRRLLVDMMATGVVEAGGEGGGAGEGRACEEEEVEEKTRADEARKLRDGQRRQIVALAVADFL